MSANPFANRAFGAIIIRSINSNFNADFTHHPRTLPDGTVYSTDKALKYAIKDYFRKFNGTSENLFYVRRLNKDMNPFDLVETFETIFEKAVKDTEKRELLRDLLSCIDIRVFGATFAPKGSGIKDKNISIHGPVQINHGVNRFPQNEIYTEDILSPFRNPGEEGSDEKAMVTIGNQTNIKEGHYVFHFSINPKNTDPLYALANEGQPQNKLLFLSTDDVAKLKMAMNNAVTALDSTRKIGTENEATIFVTLKQGSIKVLPSFTELIDVTRSNGKVRIDCTRAAQAINAVKDEVEKVELYYDVIGTEVIGLDGVPNLEKYNILNNQKV
jgi:CRISPR-associated protein Csh2